MTPQPTKTNQQWYLDDANHLYYRLVNGELLEFPFNYDGTAFPVFCLKLSAERRREYRRIARTLSRRP